MLGMTRNGSGKWNSGPGSSAGSPTMNSSGNQMSKNMMSGNRPHETIHSGHFMVSDFEPESEVQDDEYEAGLSIPEETAIVVQSNSTKVPPIQQKQLMLMSAPSVPMPRNNMTNSGISGPGGGIVTLRPSINISQVTTSNISIDGSLTKLFQCMTLAYRQKLTSPKWNRFKGVRLRWKDKIRLNNVIWRCWHMQFILRQKALVCQFASPLEVDQHNKPEAVVMEGKYWKRKLSTVAAEYKKWRLFYRNRIMGSTHMHPIPDLHPVSLDGFDWNRVGTFGGGPIPSFIYDDDLLMDFSDTLFSSLSCQQLPFPNPREIARAGMVADFIQPGLVQLQPNLDDFMDTLEPLQDFVTSKFLSSVPEEYENLDTPGNFMNSEGLPNMLKTDASSMGMNSYQKLNNISSHPHISTYGAANDNQQLSIGYSSPLTQLMSNSGQSSSLSSSVSSNHHVQQAPGNLTSGTLSMRSSGSGRKENQQSSQHSRGATSTSYGRNDVFAVPKVKLKPRGKSRNVPISTRQMHSPNSISPISQPGNVMQHHQTTVLPTQMGHHQQMSQSMMNSNTLLSHLLTNNPSHGHGQGTHYTGGTLEKLTNVQGGNMGQNHHMMATQNVQSGMMGPAAPMNDTQQHQQPWNPKNANEVLHPHIPINFGANKPMVPIKYESMNLGFSSGGGGNVSPPLLSNTPSPPMAPAGGPTSPSRSFRPKPDNDREHRRVCHINAEQKRRCNIKNGFDMLHSLIPQLSHNPNAKVSKAAMLQKGAEYIRQLKIERTQLKQEIEAHRQEVDALNATISNCQLLLPATGAPVSRQRTNKMKEMFDHWVRMRTAENWRFWIFSILIRPLLDTFNNSVSTASVDELCRTVLAWVDQHCSLVDLRPAVLNSLRYLCTSTDILSNPANLPEEAYKAVNRQDNTQDRLSGSADDS